MTRLFTKQTGCIISIGERLPPAFRYYAFFQEKYDQPCGVKKKGNELIKSCYTGMKQTNQLISKELGVSKLS